MTEHNNERELTAAEASDAMAGAFRRITARARRREAVEAFYAAVNARAEADILAGGPVTGAHHRSLEFEIARVRAAATANLVDTPGE